MSGGPPGHRSAPHIPVLYQQVLDAVQAAAGGRYLDGTVGAGGHAAGILERSSPDGQLLGLDLDPDALQLAGERLAAYGERVHLRRASYDEMVQQANEIGWSEVQGVLLDLGLSSMQLEDPERGFSFQREGPLDMRFGPDVGRTAAELVNELKETELAELIADYGEERRARRVARAIVEARPLHTTGQLAEVVAQAVGRRSARIHPATRTFQALRIAVNDELNMLRRGLQAAIELLVPGGRLAVIAFHSLEDRIVKRTFRRESQNCICPPEQPVCTCDHEARLVRVSRGVITPDEEEIERNPRARSARLRIAERLEPA